MPKSMVVLCFFVVLLTSSCAQKTDTGIQNNISSSFSAVLVVKNLDIPWGFCFLPDGSMLITEKKGEIIRFKDGEKTQIANVPSVYVRGQGGLLDIELHPDFASNNWVYLSYSSDEGPGKGGNTTIARAKLSGNALTDLQILYRATPNTTSGVHFGSRLEFDDAGYLFFTIGERGERDINPQDITRDGGKVYRIYDDGSIPQDNPFVDVNGAKTAIYTYGNRNPQGMALHPETREIWIHEHGPRGGDEINIIRKGTNYGWPEITYGINYSGTPITDQTEQEGMAQPIHYWDPSIAPSGMAFVTSERYPDWTGDLLVGSLSFQYLERLEMDGEKVVLREKLLEDIGRVRHVRQGPDGYIYVSVEGKGIYRLEPDS